MIKMWESAKSSLLVESEKILSGPFAVLNSMNQNERIYPDDVYKEAYAEIASKIPARRLLGELDHPMQYDEVRLTNVSHLILECSINEDGVVEGRVELLDTPAGKIAQALVRAGIPLGISSRGLGATKEIAGGGTEVTKLKLITFDLVAEPSFKTAVLSKVSYDELEESLKKIEKSLPLHESKSQENKLVKNTMKSIRESVKTEDSELFSLLESETKKEDLDSLTESLDIYKDQVVTLEGILEARNSELSKFSKTVSNQQSIINKLKIDLKESKSLATPATDISEFVDTIGEMTIKLEESNSKLKDKVKRSKSLQKNMDKLQEEFNVLNKDMDKTDVQTETLIEEVITLRKKLSLETRGLSWDRYSPLLEGLTTEREINDKLRSVNNLTSVSRSVDPGKVAKALTESLAANKGTENAKRLSSIISRV